MQVVEIFYSIQGEGLRAGQATIFIRLAGCNLDCDFCDTKYARDPQSGEEMTIDAIIGAAKLASLDCQWVCITGGEPYHQNLRSLTHRLKQYGYKIQIETNGTIFQETIADHITISPKQGHPLNWNFFTHRFDGQIVEMKYVVSNDQDMPIEPIVPASLQPKSNDPEAIRFCVDKVKKEPNKWRFSLQLHKILSIR